MTMVQGTLHLDDGETVIIVADDMLSALKMANDKYYGRTLKMDFKTVDEKDVWVEWKRPPEVIPDGKYLPEVVTLDG